MTKIIKSCNLGFLKLFIEVVNAKNIQYEKDSQHNLITRFEF